MRQEPLAVPTAPACRRRRSSPVRQCSDGRPARTGLPGSRASGDARRYTGGKGSRPHGIRHFQTECRRLLAIRSGSIMETMNLGFPEMIFLFLLALIIFGPKKLPEIGRQIGRLSMSSSGPRTSSRHKSNPRFRSWTWKTTARPFCPRFSRRRDR